MLLVVVPLTVKLATAAGGILSPGAVGLSSSEQPSMFKKIAAALKTAKRTTSDLFPMTKSSFAEFAQSLSCVGSSIL
jgi:hypothetical protein